MASSVSAFGLPASSRASRSAFSLATTTSLRPLGGGEVGGENGGENGGVVAPCLVNVIAVDASSGIPASSNIASFGGTHGPWLRLCRNETKSAPSSPDPSAIAPRSKPSFHATPALVSITTSGASTRSSDGHSDEPRTHPSRIGAVSALTSSPRLRPALTSR